MRTKTGVLVVLATMMCACPIGPTPTSMAISTAPRGTDAAVAVDAPGLNNFESGELIAVRSDDLLILTSRGLVSVPYEGLRSGTFSRARPDELRGPPTEAQRETLARYCRYPFGLEGEQLSRFLEALGQDALIEARR